MLSFSESQNKSVFFDISAGTFSKNLSAPYAVSTPSSSAADVVTLSVEQLRIDLNALFHPGNDLTARAAEVTSTDGALLAQAGGDLVIEAGEAEYHFDRAIYKKKSGALSSTTKTIRSTLDSTTAQASAFSGDTITLVAGRDLAVQGSHVVATHDTTLISAAIASTDQAVEEGRNTFSTGGELALVDLKNHAEYEAEAVSVNIGTGLSTDGQLKPQGTSAGHGEDSGEAHSVTTAGISGIAGDTEVRTGDAPTGIDRIFDADKVQKEIDAQVRITQMFSQQAHQAVDTYVQEARKTLREQMQQAATEEEKAAIQAQLDDLLLQERVMNVLIGAVTGMGGSALTKEALSAAADEMRRIMIEDSGEFLGVIDTDGKPLDNISGESEGVRGDGIKLGGTRVDLDLLCGADNSRCKTNADGSFDLKDGQIQFLGSFEKFLETPEGQKMIGATGGIQGFKGTLFGVPYEPGSWQDKLIEAFAGTHDYVGGSLSGLYDKQGNATRGRSDIERRSQDTWSATGAIVVSAPFAAAELFPSEVWTAISIFLQASK